MSNNDWTDEKEALLTEFNQWLTGWTNSDPRPHRLIDLLLDIKPYIEMANEAEYNEYKAWWETVKAAACNGRPMPAQ